MADDSQRVIWGSLPDWISEISEEGGIYRYVLLVMVSAVLAFFEATAGFLFRTMYWLFVWPVRTVFETIAGVSRPFWMLLDWTAGFQATIEAAASSAGLTGPLVALAGWLVPAILIIGILNVVLGVAETYLPLSAIPILGRWFR
jgi:hypothetical protein